MGESQFLRYWIQMEKHVNNHTKVGKMSRIKSHFSIVIVKSFPTIFIHVNSNYDDVKSAK